MSESLQNRLIHKKESIYFVLVLVCSVLMYATLLFTIVGILIILGLIFISLFLHGIMISGIKRNGVKMNEKQFPELYEKAKKTASDMGLDNVPDIYIVESQGELNAFATRLFKRNIVVLYSGIFELMEKGAEKEILYVLAHEFAHLKRKHVLISTFILPAMWVPFLGNAYLRACEYTCDRYAAHYVQSLEASTNALTMLAIGTKLYDKVNQKAYMEQIQSESGFFVWFHEKLSTHPHLPKRIYALSKYFSDETTVELKEPKRGVWVGLIGSIMIISLVSVGTIEGVKKVGNLSIWSDLAWILEDDGGTELMDAASENDDETVKMLIEDGADLEVIDYEGYTALHWAVLYDQYHAAQTLLEAGANPDAIDLYESTPLITATFNGNVKMVNLLLEYGADATYEDYEGYTAYEYALESEDESIIYLFEKHAEEINIMY